MTKGIGGVIEKRKYMNHENTVYRYGNIEFVQFLLRQKGEATGEGRAL